MSDLVYVLRVEHGNGANVSVHGSRETARVALAAYVRHWWGDVAGLCGNPDVAPADDGEAIDGYFDAVDAESYSIDLAIVRP